MTYVLCFLFVLNGWRQADEVVCLDAIGEGPFGTVFEGRYRGSTVAVKKMRMTAQPQRPAARKDMEMELEVEATRMGTYVRPLALSVAMRTIVV